MPQGCVAARTMAWKRRMGNLPGPLMGASQPNWLPDGRLNVRIELLVDGGWVDITDRVRVGGVAQGISISPRGRPDWQSRVTPTIARFSINNLDGLFSTRNPNSPYFGKLGRNTQCRIWVGSNLRFTGEIAEFPQQWNLPGTDVWVPVQAAGITRRLGKGSKPLPSPIYREVTSTANAAYRVAYWPMEEGSTATQLSSPLVGVATIVPTGTVNYGSYTGFPGSAATVTLTTGARIDFPIPASTDGQFKAGFLLHLPAAAGISNGTILARFYTSGTVYYWDLVYVGLSGSNPIFTLNGYDRSSALIIGSFPNVTFTNLFSDEDMALDIENYPSPSTPGQTRVTLGGQRITLLDNTFTNANSDYASLTVGHLTRIVIAPNANFNNIPVGHLFAGNDRRFLAGLGPALIGNNGETAAARIGRLCAENNVPFRLTGDASASARVGPQTIDTLLNLVQAAADVDRGILYEPRDMIGLGYRTRTSLYNQQGVSISYTALMGSLEPRDDDQLIRNLVKATRIGGSSETYEQETGPLSTADVEDGGVGVYDEELQLNAYADSQLLNIASFEVAQGTVDEARWPVIELDLAVNALRSSDALMNAIMALDSGIYLAVTGMPAWLPPDDVELLVQGTSEDIGVVTWGFGFNATPYAPYRVFVFDRDRLSSDATTRSVATSSTQTTITVSVSDGTFWTQTDVPFDVFFEGERMTVTAVGAPSGSLQVFTVTRSVNGIVKSHDATAFPGSAFTLADPARLAL